MICVEERERDALRFLCVLVDPNMCGLPKVA